MSNNEISGNIKVLLNPDLVRRLNPWELKVYVLLELFKKYLEETKLTDFRLSGIAVSTSSMIYEMKVKKLFYEPKKKEQLRPEVSLNVDVNLQPYIPLEIPVADLDDLIEAFKEMIKGLSNRQDLIPKGIEPSTLPVINETLVLEALKKYEDFVLTILKERRKATLYDIIKSNNPLEIVRMFLAILLLLSDGRIDIDEHLQIFIK